MCCVACESHLNVPQLVLRFVCDLIYVLLPNVPSFIYFYLFLFPPPLRIASCHSHIFTKLYRSTLHGDKLSDNSLPLHTLLVYATFLDHVFHPYVNSGKKILFLRIFPLHENSKVRIFFSSNVDADVSFITTADVDVNN